MVLAVCQLPKSDNDLLAAMITKIAKREPKRALL